MMEQTGQAKIDVALHQCAGVAQLVEHLTCNQKVASSILAAGSITIHLSARTSVATFATDQIRRRCSP